jgi:hypothetical protein
MRNAQLANGTVFWQNFLGELMVAPDSRMKPLPGWTRHECKTVASVEEFSRRMAKQEYDKFKNMKVDEHLRSQRRREELKANCRIRLAKGCISAEDERLTRETLRSLERKDEALYRLISDQAITDRAHLVIEEKEESTANAAYAKPRGLQDADVNAVGKLVEAMA